MDTLTRQRLMSRKMLNIRNPLSASVDVIQKPANQLTSFYMTATLALNGLNKPVCLSIYNILVNTPGFAGLMY